MQRIINSKFTALSLIYYEVYFFWTIVTFNWTSRYLDDLLNINNPHFEGMVNLIYPEQSQYLDTAASFLDLHFPVENRFVSYKIYDKRDDFDFYLVLFSVFEVPFLVVLMVYTFLNLLGLPESAIRLTDNRVMGIINFDKHFLNFMEDTMNWFQNIMLG